MSSNLPIVSAFSRWHLCGQRSPCGTITVGAVDKVQARVDATQAGQTRPLVVNSDVYFSDRCHSREGARLQATLKDGTQLMLGENATFVVDEFI